MEENKTIDKETLYREWRALLDKKGDYYIYGAANTAKRALEAAADAGMSCKIKGFVVSNGGDNPKYVAELPVIDVHELEDKSAHILVPHAGVYKRQINSLLETLGFHNVYSICKFTAFIIKGAPQRIADADMDRAKEQEMVYNATKSPADREKDAAFRKYINEIREAGRPDFGQVQFYQSFEQIGLTGTRPTLYRIEKYRMKKFLRKEQDILDIGCNTGFLDMEIASMVKTVTGVEYDQSLVEVANCVKEYVAAENCTFLNRDFHDWYQKNDRTYNVIFSFAIHHWLNLEPEEYAQRIDKLLSAGGYVCFESHDLCEKQDEEYEDCLSVWRSIGYHIENQGDIMDDGITERHYVILRKDWREE